MLSRFQINNFYHCPKCNKKYKTADKFEKHVDENHPFLTFDKNSAKLSLEDKFYLLDCFEEYSNVLIMVPDDTNIQFINASQKLLPGILEPSPDEVKRMTENHIVFRQRIIESQLLAKMLSSEINIFLAFDEFERFLNLGKPWKGGNFCPSLIIDLIWHSAMMNTEKYTDICERFVKRILPHCLIENEGQHDKRFEEFMNHFKRDHNRSCLQIGDLILTEGNDGISNARQALKVKKDVEEKDKAEEMERHRIQYEKYRVDIEEQKRNGTYQEYRGDGKC